VSLSIQIDGLAWFVGALALGVLYVFLLRDWRRERRAQHAWWQQYDETSRRRHDAGTLRAILSRLAVSGDLVVSGADVRDHLSVSPVVVLTRLARQKLEQVIEQFATGPLGLRSALSAALNALDFDAPLSPEHHRVLEDHRGGWFFLAGEVRDLLAALSDAAMRRVTS
jgi:hypothetical protein